MSRITYHPRPAILDLVPLDRHAVLEASAGTGKTFTLEHLVVELLRRGLATIEQVLVVTFTDKATREMRQRLRATLDTVRRATATTPLPGPAFVIDDAARARLDAAAFRFDRAPISTIHAFCHRVLTDHAFDSGRLFEQEQVEPRRAFGRVFREVLREVLAEAGPVRDVLDATLSDVEPDDLEQDLYAWYVERGEPALTFDGDAFVAVLQTLPSPAYVESSERGLRKGIQRGNQVDAVMKRLHALAAVGEQFRADRDVAAALAACTAWAREKAGETRALPYVLDHVGRAVRFDPTLRPLLDAAQGIERTVIPPMAVLVGSLLPRVRDRLAHAKRRAGQLDFDDMLLAVRDALRGPAGGALVTELRRRHRYALVDEFQDTDEVQWDIFRTLFFDGDGGHRLFLIGDPKQAIYGFRNADVFTYRAAKAAVLQAGGAVVPLRESHRSTEPLVRAQNRILERFFTGANAYPDPVVCAEPRRAALDRDGRPAAPIVLVDLPDVPSDARDALLSDFIAREVRVLLDGALTVTGPGTEPRRLLPSDIHVLTRTGDEGVRAGTALRRHGIPFAFFKQDGLFQTDEAHHVRDLLAAIADPTDRSRRMRAWLTPFFDVRLDELDRCRDLPPTHPLVQRLFHWKGLADGLPPAQLFQAVLRESGYVRRELFRREGERELTNVLHVLDVLLEEAHRQRRPLEELVVRLDAYIDKRAFPAGDNPNVQRLSSEARAVQVLTMHKAKGLEAEVVFLFGGFGDAPHRANEPRIFHDGGRRRAWLGPAPDRIEAQLDAEADEEVERLLYVAITRPRSRLYLPLVGGKVRGPYARLNARLHELVKEGAADGVLFARVPAGDASFGAPAPVASLAGWEPPPALLAPRPPAADFAALRRSHAGPTITSYSKIKATRAAQRPPDAPAEPFVAEAVDLAPTEPGPGELPGGAASGVFLHEVLEHLAFETLLATPDLAAWGALPDVAALFASAADRNGIDPRHLAHAKALVFETLRSPIAEGDLALPRGLAAAERRVAEMVLLYPMPESFHPPLSERRPPPDRAPFEVDRGYVRGVVDLVFEQDGRVYFLDWKSDRLPAFDGASLERHVVGSYELQAKLYTLGIVRLLDLHDEPSYRARFGGLLYCFLRGMPGAVRFERPSFATVLSWEAEFRRGELP